MADYTPDAPKVLGNEWVPLKYQLYPLDHSQEIGTSFTLDAATTVVSGHVYVDGTAETGNQGRGTFMAVYPEGGVSEGGPIYQSVLACNGALSQTSGSGTVTSESGTYVGDLASGADSFTTDFEVPPSGLAQLTMYFDVNSHTELTGKRILKLEFLYTFSGVIGDIPELLNDTSSAVRTIRDVNSDSESYAGNEQLFPSGAVQGEDLYAVDLGNIAPIWDVPANGVYVYPWTYDLLKQFDTAASAAVRIGVAFTLVGNSTIAAGTAGFGLGYAALRVTYCEEKRVLFGGLDQAVTPSTNALILRPPSLATIGATLNQGRYDVLVSRFTRGILDTTGPINLNSIIEAYPMVKQGGLILPISTTVGDSVTAEATSTMVQLSLHTASAAVTGVHPYGTQIAAPVWGSATNPARQEIVSSAAATPTNYAVARFYARHLPGTTAPLTLRHSTLTTITASITVEDFDALDEIVDGWREVTLTFSSPTPSFGSSGSLEIYEWTSAATVGTQWQVMAAAAPEVTGTSTKVQATGAQALDGATYGGSSANLRWNNTEDTTADATLMFATTMPAVSGLALTTRSLTVTGIGLECSLSPDCIPTGISYNSLTWTPLAAASMPASGFGFYELQRADTVDDWSTILEASSPLVSGFADMEARVGVLSRYRIRFMHRLEFPSAWSSEVTSTLPSPGVSGTGADNGVLIFTSNEVQNGSASLAYAMQWDREVDEEFSFLEASTVQFQRMYGRDFQVAFHGTERGGERFSRTLLLQAAAVPTGLIQQGFRSLRDLAWEDLSYVCVRDELGDRWLANVGVPSGNVRRNRTLYMANVDITEVTDTPSVVALPGDAGCTTALWDALPGWDYACWAD